MKIPNHSDQDSNTSLNQAKVAATPDALAVAGTTPLSPGLLLGLLMCLFAFAANSLLCRMALSETDIDPLLFTNFRLISGALILPLLTLVLIRVGSSNQAHKNPLARVSPSNRHVFNKGWSGFYQTLVQWQGGFYLFLYMLGFSLAYQELATGVGALLLFGAVQMTMTLIGFYRREFPATRQWIGWCIALSGLVLLISSHNQADSTNSTLFGVLWMLISGIGWGLYSAYGQNNKKAVEELEDSNDTGLTTHSKTNSASRPVANLVAGPVERTRQYFFQASLLIMVLTAVLMAIQPELLQQLTDQWDIYHPGIWLAVGSGAITSALGYILWYQVLPHLSTLEAASSQLIVPIIAAAMGMLLLSEPLTVSFVVASILALSGLALVIMPSK